MREFIARFLRDRSGATAIEYALVISLIFLVMVTAVTAFGNIASGLFNVAMETLRSTVAG